MWHRSRRSRHPCYGIVIVLVQLGPARFAVPVPLWRGRRDLPQRPVHQGAPAGEDVARIDPGRPRDNGAVRPPSSGLHVRSIQNEVALCK